VKKLVSICLILVILLSQYGHFCFYAFQAWQLKKEFKAKVISSIPDTLLEKIIDNDNIVWKEKGKEFFLDGELYDIVRTGISGGKKCYIVINDHLEKKLVGEFNRILKSQNNHSKRSRANLKFQPSVFTIITESAIVSPFLPQKRTYFITSAGILSQPNRIIPHPPPFLVV